MKNKNNLAGKGIRKTFVLFAGLIIIVLILTGFFIFYFIFSLDHKQDKSLNKRSQDLIGQSAFKSSEAQKEEDFSTYKFIELDFKPSIEPYSITIKELSNLKAMEKERGDLFSRLQKNQLLENHFLIDLNKEKFWDQDPQEVVFRNDDWTELYKQISGSKIKQKRGGENAVFITSDYLLHVYHRLLEKEFEYVEYNRFYPKIKNLSNNLLEKSIDQYNQSQNPVIKESFERLIAYFLIPSALLEPSYKEFEEGESSQDRHSDTLEKSLLFIDSYKEKIPDYSYKIAKKEIKLIMEAQAMEESVLFGPFLSKAQLNSLEDYTQYGPRSHYNKNSVLRSYFRAMMWYGRSNFLLLSDELTLDALNITLLMDENNKQDWEDIYHSTAFFVGKSDDLSFYEFGKVLEENFGGKLERVDFSVVNQIQKELKSYKNPQIMSLVVNDLTVMSSTETELKNKTKGFRFMGQRFTPDAFVFSSLTQGNELSDQDTGESLPSMTSAMLFFAVMGNETAEPLAEEWIEKNAPDSRNVLAKEMNKLKNYFSNQSKEDWNQNIYWSWIYTLRSLFDQDKDLTGYPMFMKNFDWSKKNLQCSLGSWTELKHDSLLYSKQSYAEMGSGPLEEDEIPDVPKGYVEPNIEFLNRLIALSEMTNQGLMERGLLNSNFITRNNNFLESLRFFREIAKKQLENQLISNQDFERLRLETYSINNAINPLPSQIITEDNARSALIADVHTDTILGEILYEATDIPNFIYVAVKDVNGVRLTKGLVFSHYEFSYPIGERLSDQDWRKWVYDRDKDQLPPIPNWVNSMLR
ncbi:MAG: DUF3160 domain-containing protein [Candidatus Moranbacteria bacterium]|nr:DUF3160 domain-containing protein [Candidatus Moranbacteria bacterium]